MSRVLLVFEYPTLFGGEMSLLALIPALQAAGFDFHAIAPGESALDAALTAKGIEVHRFAWREGEFLNRNLAGPRRPLPELRAELSNLFHSLQADLVHANSLSVGRIIGPVVSLPSISHLRDILRLNATAIADLNQNSRLIAVSQATREFHVAQGIDAAKTSVIYNGIDLTQFHPQPRSGWLHDELQIPRTMRLVGNIGQISLRKGQDMFLQAAQSIAEREDDVHFLILGARYSMKEESERFEESLRTLAAEPPLAGRVHFLGIRTDMARLLPELSLLLHTARQEPLGRVLLEAAACGLPVVATDVGGTNEIFPSGSHAAILVRPDDPTAHAEAANRMLVNPNEAIELASAARIRIEEVFDANHASAELAKIYREVVAT